jgi:hypothetical protein
MKKIQYDRILKDCFWDLNLSENDIKEIVLGDDERKKVMLFEKILLNSTAFFKDLEIFSKNELKKLLENYTLPSFNKDFAFRRKNMAEVYFLGKPLLISELQWIV